MINSASQRSKFMFLITIKLDILLVSNICSLRDFKNNHMYERNVICNGKRGYKGYVNIILRRRPFEY